MDFSPYFGTEKVKALQQARDEQVATLAQLPGAVVHARTFSSDDPVKLGWEHLRKIMSDEGMVTLRGADIATVEVAKEKLSDFDPKLHIWDLFMADAKTIRNVCGAIVQSGLPDGVKRISEDAMNPQKAREVQAFLTDQGVSPFSTDALLGKLFPARLIALQNSDDRIVAAGFAAMTHNRHSPYHKSAWVGLIAVDPELRGLGLGKLVDAICNLSAVTELQAASTMEFVAQDNAPSRAMLESCGLRQVEGKSVVMFSTSADRITR
ncbi:GNAT family N-acetyltransferase [Phaeobacter gallaeciensis]|uniref:GNAT family N-acetyltransferase n=1 Tax=Phaeobacter gallaeciensis TaxID=60890 RepID=UPI00237F567A|nr:GNAT family N-acetyltransferase [Phaeobacter gallaeciensis]MDE4100069.1 GNAT family N-acetyltransferase [Phaeobacter gallaeciensis]MDE4108890.1 GNAT family N-acetyltransferase [Phaeobacter gallaeciensis]MDE4113336.1 GNAT family N-acetyltransferase [Phaeobacter gallaeciensis]MDE4117750.1 GNAT family N-acetyltransferase [Phaeobacter gallaeciensis]MDE4122253.1 GNAT family N-acetyltransferase [Phaeobacter gallaeciensis]